MQVPLGGGAYVRATVDDVDEVIVSIGADYAAERERDGAVELLGERKDNIDERIQELNEAVAEEHAYATLGSRHGLKRTHVEIAGVEPA